MNRRTFIFGTIFSPFLINSKSYSIELIPIHVFKDPNCGCCNEWIKILMTEGFNVTSENMFSADLVQFKIKNNIPINMVSCHTAKVDNYLIEGHVPSYDIKSLVINRLMQLVLLFLKCLMVHLGWVLNIKEKHTMFFSLIKMEQQPYLIAMIQMFNSYLTC